MTILSKEQIINLHKQLIDETGGANGLRDEGLLDSAYNDSTKIGKACFRINQQSPFCGWEQTNRSPHHADYACVERHRTQLHARRIVHDHFRYRVRCCRTK